MSTNREMKEMDGKLSAALELYLGYYDFAATDEKVFALTGMYAEDISDFYPGDAKDGCTFVGYLFAKDPINTFLDTLLVFRDKDGKYIVGSTVGGTIIPIDIKGALD